jgi:hypothetical protein
MFSGLSRLLVESMFQLCYIEREEKHMWQRGMAKAITTITQRLTYHPQQADWFAANQALFNAVTAFYFDVIQAHDQILTLKTKEALTALETLTHTTEKNPNPVLPSPQSGRISRPCSAALPSMRPSARPNPFPLM